MGNSDPFSGAGFSGAGTFWMPKPLAQASSGDEGPFGNEPLSDGEPAHPLGTKPLGSDRRQYLLAHAQAAQLGDQTIEHRLGVAEDHGGLGQFKEAVFDAGVARS